MAETADLAEKALSEILDKALSGIDFAAEQAPLVIQELLAYKTFEHSASFIIFFLLAAVAAKLTAWAIKKKKESGSYKGEEFLVCALVSGVLTPIFSLCALSDAFSLAQAMIAPKVYLIEYAAKLAN